MSHNESLSSHQVQVLAFAVSGYVQSHFFVVAALRLIVIVKSKSSLFNFLISFVYPFLHLKSINIFSLADVKYSL